MKRLELQESNVFGRLTLIKELPKTCEKRIFLVKCSCGNEKSVRLNDLVSGNTKSCGCLRKEKAAIMPHPKKHGMTNTRMYRIWKNIISRCNNENNKDYKYYGERGIKCEWIYFIDFKNDMYPSYQKHLSIHGEKDTTIERIDNDKGYMKSNCKWTTMLQQSKNKRTK